MQLTTYRTQIQSAATHFRHLSTLASSLQMENAAQTANRLLSRMDDERFRLVVVGEFSRGKSTFVNALLGRKILPASKNPTTAIISKIVYGETPEYYIYNRGEPQPERLPEEAFFRLTAPKEPDEGDEESVREFVRAQERLSRIDYAEIVYPLSFCRDHVEVVDTPGTNDLNAGRIEITYRYLDQADAVILLLAADQALTASEAAFLRERILASHISDIFFVVSHRDTLDGDEEAERSVLAFVEKNLAAILPKDVSLRRRVFLVSGRGALLWRQREAGETLTPKQEMILPEDFADTGFPDFEAALGDYLTKEKGRAKIRRYIREARAVLRSVEHDLSVQMGVAEHSADEIRQKAEALTPTFRQAKRKAEGIVSEMRLSFESAGANIDYKCHAAAQAILEKAKAAVDNLTRDMPAAAMKETIERAASAEKKQFLDGLFQEWQTAFGEAQERAQTGLREIWQDIDVEYQRAFRLPAVVGTETALTIAEPEPEEEETSFTKDAYRTAGASFRRMFSENMGAVDRLFNGVIGAVAGVAGAVSELWSTFFGQRKVKKDDWKVKIRAQVVDCYGVQGDEMASSLCAQYREQTESLCNSTKAQADARIEDMERQLQALLREKEAQEQDAAKKRAQLEAKQKELREIARGLEDLAR